MAKTWNETLFLPPGNDHVGQHVVQTPLVGCYEGDQQDEGRQNRYANIKQHGLHGGVQKRYAGPIRHSHFKIGMSHPRSGAAPARYGHTVVN